MNFSAFWSIRFHAVLQFLVGLDDRDVIEYFNLEYKYKYEYHKVKYEYEYEYLGLK